MSLDINKDIKAILIRGSDVSALRRPVSNIIFQSSIRRNLADQIVDVTMSLIKLPCIHTLASVKVKVRPILIQPAEFIAELFKKSRNCSVASKATLLNLF